MRTSSTIQFSNNLFLYPNSKNQPQLFPQTYWKYIGYLLSGKPQKLLLTHRIGYNISMKKETDESYKNQTLKTANNDPNAKTTMQTYQNKISITREKPCSAIQQRNTKIKIFSKIRKIPINTYGFCVYSQFTNHTVV